MPMMLVQMQFTDITEPERDLIPDFCEWLCSVIFSDVNNKINRKKISLRMKYILESVDWVNWNSDKYSLTTMDILNSIKDAITFNEYKNNIWKIEINPNIIIPYSNTSIDRLVRFLNFGDSKQRGTGMFSLEKKYDYKKLNSLWQIFLIRNLGTMTTSKIITR